MQFQVALFVATLICVAAHIRLPVGDSGHFFIFENGGRKLLRAVPVSDVALYSSVEELTSSLNSTKLWTLAGEPLRNISAIKNGDRLFDVLPNHHFFWPCFKIGYKFRVDVGRSKFVEVETMSLVPRVFKISNFIEQNEIDHFIKTASPHLEESMVGTADNPIKNRHRTSRTSWIPTMHDHIVSEVDKRIARLLRIPFSEFVKLTEDWQVVSYGVGQQYGAHYDFAVAGPDSEIEHRMGRNRMMTVLMYLSDVEGGGATNFPKFRSKTNVITDCTRGLSVKPNKGDAILFYDLQAIGHVPGAGKEDMDTLHSGCPVLSGHKWVTNKWIANWSRIYGDVVP